MEGDEKGGFTIFFADEGLDTGPILLTRETAIEPDDTVLEEAGISTLSMQMKLFRK